MSHYAPPATQHAPRKWFHELERAAGLEPVKSRAWNGLHRLSIDKALGETASAPWCCPSCAPRGTHTAAERAVCRSARAAVHIARCGHRPRCTPSRTQWDARGLCARASATRPTEKGRHADWFTALAALTLRAVARGCPRLDPQAKTRIREADPGRRTAASSGACRKERATGLEPATSSLGSWHSTN